MGRGRGPGARRTKQRIGWWGICLFFSCCGAPAIRVPGPVDGVATAAEPERDVASPHASVGWRRQSEQLLKIKRYLFWFATEALNTISAIFESKEVDRLPTISKGEIALPGRTRPLQPRVAHIIKRDIAWVTGSHGALKRLVVPPSYDPEGKVSGRR
ncbi:hypothetical protein NDU88_006249 [Pleurodeles waltl]|uniref:Uncharacterized protein n=1 Tax=Pleurodeles waltl TaxID=8319 RepID=A0AAV7VQV0_PLEWA|nr:hypothetical protein NDU88_006249 [Pleurodeles waltl]